MIPQAEDAQPGEAIEERFSLEVPADPASIRTARLFAGAVARHFACPEDLVEDVKLAVSEACTEAVRSHGALAVEDPVRLVVRPVGLQLVFEVLYRAGERPRLDDVSPGDVAEVALGPTLIRSLFDDADVSIDGGVATLRFRTPIAPPLDG